MATRLDELYIELKLKAGEYLNEIAKVKKETEALAKASGTGAATSGQLSSSVGRLGEGAKKASNAVTNLATSMVGLQGSTAKLVEGLLLLGAGSVTVTAIAAGVAVIGAAIRLLKKDSEEADKAAQGLVATYRDALGLKAQDDIDKTRRSLADLRAEQQRLQPLRQTGFRDASGTTLNEREFQRVTKAIEEQAAALALAEIALAEYQQGIGDAGGETGDAAKEAEAAARKLAAFQEQVRQAGLAASAGLADLSGDPLTKKIAELDAAISNVQATQERLGAAAPDTLNAWLAKLQEVREQTLALQRSVQGFTVQVEALPDDPLPGQAGLPPILRGVGRPARARTSADDVVAERNKLEVLREQSVAIELQAANINRAVQGALQLGEAFGVVGEEVAAVVSGLAQAVTSIPTLVNGINVLKEGGGVGGLLSGGLGVLGAIASIASGLFGESPEQRANREAVERNTALLARVAQGLESFGTGISSRDRARANAALAGFGPIFESQPDVYGPERALRIAAERAGISMAELERIAKDLGIEFVATEEGVRIFQEALDLAPGAAFGPGFQDRLAGSDLVLGIKDNTTALERAQAFQQSLQGQDAGRLNQLSQFDLTTEAGRAAAEAFALETAELLNKGIRVDTGALTGEEFRAAIADFDDLIDQAQDEALVPGQQRSEQFAIDQAISVAQGSEISASLFTANVHAKRTADNTAHLPAIRELLEQLVLARTGEAVSSAPANATLSGDYAATRARALGSNRIA